jgi:hypothetical protein
MAENEYQDIHDALGILPTEELLSQPPTSSPYSEITSSVPKALARFGGDVLGVNDALRAWRGEMTPNEAEKFALTAAAGLVPAGRAENILAKGGIGLAKALRESPEKYPALLRGAVDVAKLGDVPEGALHGLSGGGWGGFVDSPHDYDISTIINAGGTHVKPDQLSPSALKQIYQQAWTKGDAPFSAIADHVKAQTGGDKSVYDIISPDTKTSWDKELTAKHGDWLNIPNSEEEEEPAKSGRDYSAHFEPLNWREHQTDPHAFADVPDWLRKHGESLGFNFDVPLYKGGWKGYPEEIDNPAQKSRERGFFTAPEETVAKAYGDVTPYVARAQNPIAVDWKKATGQSYYSTVHMAPLIEQAREQKADLLAIHNIRDIGKYDESGAALPQSQYVVLDPSILRAPSAKFKVEDLHKAAPLAGVATVAGGYPIFSSSAPSEGEVAK